MDTVVSEVERRLEAYEDPIEVSVLGCAVNGIGEARHADFGITGAKDMGMIYSKGEPLKKVPTEQLVDELFKEIDRYYASGKTVQRDETAAAEARACGGRCGRRRRDGARVDAGARRRAGRSRLAGRRTALLAGLSWSSADRKHSRPRMRGLLTGRMRPVGTRRVRRVHGGRMRPPAPRTCARGTSES